MAPTRKPTKSHTFTAEERDAMKERAREAKAGVAADPEAEVMAKLAEMSPSDRALGERLHALIKAAAPELTPRLWYGMPAYAKEGQLICHYQCAAKFKTRYATLGFSDKAKLDDGDTWPVAYSLTELTPTAEKKLAALVKRAAS